MKLLIDANLSPKIVDALSQAGYDAEHVVDLGLVSASDEVIFDRAVADGSVVVTADSDFSMMLALRGAKSPSVVLLRHVAELPRATHARLLVENLPTVLADLERGAIVSLSPTRLAVRSLPIG